MTTILLVTASIIIFLAGILILILARKKFKISNLLLLFAVDIIVSLLVFFCIFGAVVYSLYEEFDPLFSKGAMGSVILLSFLVVCGWRFIFDEE